MPNECLLLSSTGVMTCVFYSFFPIILTIYSLSLSDLITSVLFGFQSLSLLPLFDDSGFPIYLSFFQHFYHQSNLKFLTTYSI